MYKQMYKQIRINQKKGKELKSVSFSVVFGFNKLQMSYIILEQSRNIMLVKTKTKIFHKTHSYLIFIRKRFLFFFKRWEYHYECLSEYAAYEHYKNLEKL